MDEKERGGVDEKGGGGVDEEEVEEWEEEGE